MEQIHHVSDMSKLSELKYKKKLIIAEFFTEWCPPCKPARMLIERQLKDCGGKFIFAMVNSDEAEELNIEYEIEGVPTIIAFNRDEKMTVFDKVVGYDPVKIKDLIERARKEVVADKK